MDGPAAAETDTTITLIPRPRPSSLSGYISLISAALTLSTAAAPKPCITLNAVSIDSVVDSAQPKDEKANSTTPAIKIFLLPTARPSAAKGIKEATTANW